MIKNFLKTAFRNLISRKGHSLMNIMGLAVGITCCLLIFEYVAYERSYEHFNAHADRIYRVQDEEYQNGKLVVACASAMPGVSPAMKREFPEVEEAVRLRKTELLIGNDLRNLRFKEPTVYYTDQSVIDIFQLKFVEGDTKTALLEPNRVIISTEVSRKYFANENAVGKMLTVYSSGHLRPLQVTGVFETYPANSHIRLNILVSYKTYSQVIGTYGHPDDVLETGFGWIDFYTYLLLRKGADPKKTAAKLPAFIDRHYNNLPENKNSGDRYSLSLVALKDIHLNSHYTEEAEANGDGQSVTFLFLIGFFIIAIAWINYINLSTARSVERAREVGVRKVLGAIRAELVWQFMMESLLLNLVALGVALILTLLINPLFSSLSGRPLQSFIHLPLNYKMYFFCFAFGGHFSVRHLPCTGVVTLPANRCTKRTFPKCCRRCLASQRPHGGAVCSFDYIDSRNDDCLPAGKFYAVAETWRQHRSDHGDQRRFRGLTDSAYRDVFGSFKGEMLRLSGVKSFTASSAVMGQEILWSTNWKKLHDGNNQVIALFHLGIDEDFIQSYGLKMIAGETFIRNSTGDSRKVMLNESAVRALGIVSPQAAVGQMISGGGGDMDSLKVTGVVADFHNEGLQKAIQPLVFFLNRNMRANYSVKLEGSDAASTIALIKKAWDQHFPRDPFDYFFLDEFFNRQYAENQRFGEVFGLFAVLAISIACFGLLGLSAYTVLERKKEIGVRKVLGASVSSLVFTLSKDFLLLVSIAFLIAVPVSAFAMHSWLEGFAYRTAMPWWIFAAAGTLSICIALSTVGVQALKAALTNPIKSLRSE